MIGLDHYLVDFIGGNSLTLYVVYTILKGIAYIHPSVTSNSIMQMIGIIYNALTHRDKTPEIPADQLEQKK